MSEHKLNTVEILVILIILALMGVFLLSGCFFARYDVGTTENPSSYQSVTVWTFMKDIHIDPNSYDSDSNRFKIITPYGVGESK